MTQEPEKPARVRDTFISEPIEPEPGSFDSEAMARGEAGVPARFTWRKQVYAVAEVLQGWISSTPEGGSGEMYLRRHWWRLRTDCGPVMVIYCERQAGRGHSPRSRWYLYTIQSPSG